MPGRFAADFPEGVVCHDYIDPETGLRIQVARGFVAFCAYVGVRADHALAGLEELRFKCHWGITWKGWGDGPEGGLRPPEWYFWGWDYGHAMDGWALPEGLAGLDDANDPLLQEIAKHFAKFTRASTPLGRPRKHWTRDEVIEDARDVLFELKEALRKSEELRSLLLPSPGLTVSGRPPSAAS